MNYYHLYEEVRKLPQLDLAKRQDLINTLSGKDITKDYSFPSLITHAIPHLNKDEAIVVFDNMINNFSARRTYYENSILDSIMKVYALDKNHVKTAIMAKNNDTYNKIVPLMEGISFEEEARGLRTLSQRKYCPPVIHNHKYAPRKEAILLLPPVSRLKAFETLSNNKHISYNVFSNFPDADEFKRMMFSSVLRHRDRAEVVWNKYQEISYLGKDAEISIETDCSNCGKMEMTIKSTRVRTKTGLQATNLWNLFKYNACGMCGMKSESPAEIKIVNDNLS